MAAAVPAVLAVTSVVSAGVSIYSAYRQNQAAQASANTLLNSIPGNSEFAKMQSELIMQQAESSRMQGEMANNMAEMSARNQLVQGELAKIEADIEAERERKAGRKLRAKQSVAYMKNGVILAGSPMLVLEETIDESERLAESIDNRGSLQYGLAKSQAAQTRARGRASLIGANLTANAKVFEANSIQFQASQQNVATAAQAGQISQSGTIDALQTGFSGLQAGVEAIHNFRRR